jgi:hypothetical protein
MSDTQRPRKSDVEIRDGLTELAFDAVGDVLTARVKRQEALARVAELRGALAFALAEAEAAEIREKAAETWAREVWPTYRMVLAGATAPTADTKEA